MYVANYCDASGAGGQMFQTCDIYISSAGRYHKKKKTWYESFVIVLAGGLCKLLISIAGFRAFITLNMMDLIYVCNYVC